MKATLLAATVALLAMVGCSTPGAQLAFNPEVSLNGWGGTMYSPTLRYGYYYPFAEIVLTNNTPLLLYPEQDGKQKVLLDRNGRGGYAALAPAQSLTYHVAVPIYVSVPTTVVVKAFTADGQFVGVASRTFQFYGNINRRLLESWVINTHEIQEAKRR